jgi:four helix bundle protein
MATFHGFEDINAWQKARELTQRIYDASGHGSFAKDFPLLDQIRRASISIMSNIAEGFERDGNKEFRQFLSTAKGSAGEVKAQLYVALDQHYLNQEHFNDLYQLADQTAYLIGGLMRHLRTSAFNGSKFQK